MMRLLKQFDVKSSFAKGLLPIFGHITRNLQINLKEQKPTLRNRLEDVNAVYPVILDDLTQAVHRYGRGETSAWLTNALEYNLRNKDKTILWRTISTYEHLVRGKGLKPEEPKLIYILGWCIEIFHTSLVMYDDIMDNGSLRRGQKCWHTLEHVGLMGVNDALMIENVIYVILKKYFRDFQCYADLMELFHEVIFIATCGKNVDLSRASTPVNKFNMTTYKIMAINKTAYDNFYLPFAAAFHLAGYKDEKALPESRAVLNDIGLFYQIQNDYLDCFGSPQVIGKIGTDIQDKKYSWLATVCMERANEEQKQTMMNCYGMNDPESVRRVKELYKLLDLTGLYAVYNQESYNEIKSRIKQLSNEVLQVVLLRILNKAYSL